ncbi:MAG: polyketide cyclase [Herbaspirillum sp.]|jgi:carbon monoxide dehydrogenase subunit G|nr:polyketide cyclase [Herbaspirillum sp.]
MTRYCIAPERRKLLVRIGAAGLHTWLTLPAALAASNPSDPATPTEITVERSERDGYPVFDIHAGITVAAPPQRVWQVLTDYDRLAEFVPNLISSRLISRHGNECVVVQEGYGRFLFVKQKIDLLLQAQEVPQTSIALTLLRGNMHEYRAEWRLNRVEANATQLIYTGAIAPAFYVPALFGTALIKSDLRNMIAAVAREMEKTAP